MQIHLDTTTKSLEVDLAGAITTNQLEVQTNAIDLLDSDQTVSEVLNTVIVTNNTTAVMAMAAPASGHTRVVKSITVFNADTVAATPSIQINANGTIYRIAKQVLAVDETLTID